MPKLDAQILVKLLKQVTCTQANALRHAVQIHATATICLRVHVEVNSYTLVDHPDALTPYSQTSGPLTFRLQLDLPYFTFTLPSEDYAEDLNVGSKVIDITCGLRQFASSVREHHTSVVISGSSHHSWFGCAIGSLDDATDVFDDTSDFHDAEKLDEVGEDWAPRPDLFATAGCEPSTLSNKVVWDPRTYFLHALCLRLGIINQANAYLLHKMNTGLRDLVRSSISIKIQP